jgi:hypothetical protein
LIVVSLTAAAASAMFAPPQDVPVDRIVKNAQAYVAEHPDDPSGYYVLGRVHYLAWTLKSQTVPVYRGVDKSGKPQVADDHALDMYQSMAVAQEARRQVLAEMKVDTEAQLKPAERRAYYQRVNERTKQLKANGWQPAAIPAEQLDEHAKAAIVNLRKASHPQTDGRGLYWLTLGSMIEQYADRAAELGLSSPYKLEKVDEPEAKLKRQWLKSALGRYHCAYAATYTKDAALEHRPIAGIQYLVSYEAIAGYRRVIDLLGGPDEKQKKVLAEMDRHMKKLQALPMGAITPIVFSFEAHSGLSDLIDERAAVAFDLDGMQRGAKWLWVKPGTALLVWDPRRTGQITSGKQLFGSVTWWLMPGDGYRALDLLDDNRDGELSGAELAGLSAWFDTNVNGVSEIGEVVPLDELPITALSTRATSREPLGLSNTTGMKLRDGSTAPTYDWFAESAN